MVLRRALLPFHPNGVVWIDVESAIEYWRGAFAIDVFTCSTFAFAHDIMTPKALRKELIDKFLDKALEHQLMKCLLLIEDGLKRINFVAHNFDNTGCWKTGEAHIVIPGNVGVSPIVVIPLDLFVEEFKEKL
jgi:hypothetical protein